MTIEGTVTQLLDAVTGEGKNGQWKKQEFILETGGKYPKQICMVMWGDVIDQSGLTVGAQITAHIDIQSREYNSKWYTDVKAWKVEYTGEAAPEEAPEPKSMSQPNDGLPF
tara:strand:+ start:262 stop:594 length:333 start_codon:yes stop_codon:yes gene_type:complete